MGRGASKSGGGGGGMTPKTSAFDSTGAVIDLSDNPLVYGKADAAVTGALRTALEAQETKRLKAKTEYGVSYDANGNVVGDEVHGGRNGVRFPQYYLTDGSTFTHNHPRAKGEEGQLGGTFSDADINTFSNNKCRTFRASGSEGTYSITKGKNFDSNGLKQYYKSVDRAADSTMKKKNAALRSDLYAGKIDYKTYKQGVVNNFNSFLVDCHNGLLAGQAQYGYSYTLEART